jgi:pimeloyl-ACP methyl ester carboxylesterase
MTNPTLPPLRLATPADVPAIADLVRRAYAPWTPVIGREPRPMSADYDGAVAAHRFDLLEEDGRLVALIETAAHADHLLVINIAVDPRRHGGGRGRRLLAHAEDLARAAGLPALRLFTNERMARNIAIYERAGYRIETVETLEIGAGVHMLKLIDPAARRLLFLPGAGASPMFWRPLGERLPPRWVKTYLGWPGLGAERPAPDVKGWGDLVTIVERALGEDGPPVDLLAQSMGGYVALAASLRRPGRVRRLVLSVTAGGIDVEGLGGSDWRSTYRADHPGAAAWIDARPPDLSSRLSTITHPALLLWGDADPISPVAVGRALAGLLPNAGLHVVASGDHDIIQTHAAMLAGLVAGFLD